MQPGANTSILRTFINYVSKKFYTKGPVEQKQNSPVAGFKPSNLGSLVCFYTTVPSAVDLYHRHHTDKISESGMNVYLKWTDGTYCLPCFVLIELLVATAKIHFEDQALVVSTKQSRQADQAGRQAGLLCFMLTISGSLQS